MTRLLLDTNAFIWLEQQNKKLGRRSRQMVERAVIDYSLYISPLSFWELGLLRLGKQMRFVKPLEEVRRSWLEAGLQELVVDHKAVARGLEIPPYHSDPVDCLIMGTAMAHDMVLLTSDEKILKWKGSLERQDAYK